MKLSQFKFKLPEEKIAKYPAPHRDECRMMVLHRKTGEIEHHMFKEILNMFDEHDVFVFNDTTVFPARLYGNKEKTGARIEVFLLRELNQELRLWDVLVDPARKIRIGNKLYFGEDNSIVAEVIDNTTSRGRTLRFLYDGDHDEFKRQLYALGEAPIPRFIGRESEPEDLERFQCIFARHEGAVTAPTAPAQTTATYDGGAHKFAFGGWNAGENGVKPYEFSVTAEYDYTAGADGILTVTDAGTYSVSVTLTDEVNFVWSGGGTEAVFVCDITIDPLAVSVTEWRGAENLVYSGEAQKPVVGSSNAIGDVRFVYEYTDAAGTAEPTDAGEYVVKATFAGNTN